MPIRNIGVLGAGTMGVGIAHVCALQGFSVMLYDVNEGALSKSVATIGTNFERQVKKGLITPQEKHNALGRIMTSIELQDAVRIADLVIEAATEKKEVKLALFQEVDSIASAHTILATNTSSISITEIAAATKRPGSVIGMHFMNPVPVMTLVEVIRGLATSQETFDAIKGVCERLGKTPVEVNDYPGFVSNRVLLPMINEAIYCVMEGVATPEAVDTVMKLGMNHPMGPLALADLIGLDICLMILNVLDEGLGDSKYRPCPLLKKMVAAGYLGRKSGKGFFEYPKKV